MINSAQLHFETSNASFIQMTPQNYGSASAYFFPLLAPWMCKCNMLKEGRKFGKPDACAMAKRHRLMKLIKAQGDLVQILILCNAFP